MSYDQLIIDSLHEAGHAVAIVAFGGRVEAVTLDSTREAEDSELEPWQAVVVCCAGAAAARAFGPAHRSLSRALSQQDRAVAESQLAKLGLGTSSHHLERAEKQARELLLDRSASVRRVAEALRRGGALSCADVERLVEGESVDDVLAAPAVADHAPGDRVQLLESTGAHYWIPTDSGWERTNDRAAALASGSLIRG